MLEHLYTRRPPSTAASGRASTVPASVDPSSGACTTVRPLHATNRAAAVNIRDSVLRARHIPCILSLSRSSRPDRADNQAFRRKCSRRRRRGPNRCSSDALRKHRGGIVGRKWGPSIAHPPTHAIRISRLWRRRQYRAHPHRHRERFLAWALASPLSRRNPRSQERRASRRARCYHSVAWTWWSYSPVPSQPPRLSVQAESS